MNFRATELQHAAKQYFRRVNSLLAHDGTGVWCGPEHVAACVNADVTNEVVLVVVEENQITRTRLGTCDVTTSVVLPHGIGTTEINADLGIHVLGVTAAVESLLGGVAICDVLNSSQRSCDA